MVWRTKLLPSILYVWPSLWSQGNFKYESQDCWVVDILMNVILITCSWYKHWTEKHVSTINCYYLLYTYNIPAYALWQLSNGSHVPRLTKTHSTLVSTLITAHLKPYICITSFLLILTENTDISLRLFWPQYWSRIAFLLCLWQPYNMYNSNHGYLTTQSMNHCCHL